MRGWASPALRSSGVRSLNLNESLPVRARSGPQSMHPSRPALFDANSSLEAFSDIITTDTHSRARAKGDAPKLHAHAQDTHVACTCAPMTRMLPVHCAPDDTN